MLESIDHQGELRFNETVPYNEQMLSVITNTNIDIVRSAMKMFIDLKMMDIFDDQTIFMAEVSKLIGSETQWAEKKRIQRSKEDNVLALSSNCPTDIDKDKEKEINKEINNSKPQKRFTPPTLEEVQAYCKERNNGVDAKAFYDYYTAGDWKDAKGKPVRNWKQKVITWERKDGSGTTDKGKFTRTFDYDRYTD